MSRRGALTGGYVDTSKSRLDLYISKQELQNDLEEKQSEVAANKDQQQTLEVGSVQQIVQQLILLIFLERVNNNNGQVAKP